MSKRENWMDLRVKRLTTPGAQAGFERARRAFELGEQVRKLREAQGLSQADLARRIGSTQPSVARLEAGGVAPSIDTLERVAVALDLQLTVRFVKTRSSRNRQLARKGRARSA